MNRPDLHCRSGQGQLWLDGAFLVALLLVALVSLGRIVTLYQTPMQLFFDEAQYWSWGRALDFGYFSKPPLLAWIIRGFTEICGEGEACIRMVSPVLYGLSALIVGLLAARVSERMGGSARIALIWGALLFATLPGVSFAARLTSTDAPLLFCFALALLFLDRLRQGAGVGNALGLGLALGFGFMAKYAMAYFVLGMIIWAMVSREGRQTLFQPVMMIVLLVAGLVVAPNILWNAQNDWITLQHTRDNGNWRGLTLHFDNMAEFIGAQIGILGPVLSLVLVLGLRHMRHMRRGETGDSVFLLCFSLPVILAMVVQATIARAHANWAAVAFIALSVLVVAWMVSWRARTLMIAALVVHLVVLGALSIADIWADRLVREPLGYAYKRVFGWREMSLAVRDLAEREGVRTLVTDQRDMTAEMLYYLRDSGLVIRTFGAPATPRNHYQMALAVRASDPGPFLVLATCHDVPDGAQRFDRIDIPVRPRFSLNATPYLLAYPPSRMHDPC